MSISWKNGIKKLHKKPSDLTPLALALKRAKRVKAPVWVAEFAKLSRPSEVIKIYDFQPTKEPYYYTCRVSKTYFKAFNVGTLVIIHYSRNRFAYTLCKVVAILISHISCLLYFKTIRPDKKVIKRANELTIFGNVCN